MAFHSRRPLCLLISVALAILDAAAGTTSDIKGRVSDSQGKPLPGAVLVLRNDALAVAERGILTDLQGRFRFEGLPPGPGYHVRATLASYASIEFSDIELSTDQTYVLDIVLRPAKEMQETVRVQAKAGVIDTERVTTSTTFNSQFIAGLPLLGRDYQDVLTLAPGVTDVDGTGNPNVHGARDTSLVTLVDGVSTTDPFTGYYGQQFNIESIQEVEVITSGATAEFGRAQGGFANVITKSGGNEFQGTFKFFMRSYRLDGDGAGIDPPELRYGFQGAAGFRDLRFTDLYPFLSLSGALVKDHLWYYVANEYLQIENPVNALTHAYVTGTRGYREFGKITWQVNSSHKVALIVNVDRMKDSNQGVDSLADVRAGYSFKRGGPTYILKESAFFTPTLVLDSTVAWFDNSFARQPNMDPDTNGNGILFVDDGDGILHAWERDPGEDWDRDRAYDLFEDLNYNRDLDPLEDLDGDGKVTLPLGCEGREHEDLDCDGRLDQEVDTNQNGILDPEEDVGITCDVFWNCFETAGNGRFDTEDVNGNGVLDVVGDSGPTPFPFWSDRNGNGRADRGEFRSPLAPDESYFIDAQGRVFGASPYSYEDHRKRSTVREDLSKYWDTSSGSHDVKLGVTFEHEAFRRDSATMPILNGSGTVNMALPIEGVNDAVGDNLGFYVQDAYKPLPNLALGIGLRLDLENIHSSGFTPFDPRQERANYDTLLSLTGTDTNQLDNVIYPGLKGDPLYGLDDSDKNRLSPIVAALAEQAPGRLTRHNTLVDIFSPYLASILLHVPTREELQSAGYQLREPEEFRIQNANVAPRLSLSWDPASDGKSKAFVSWSRFYDKLFLNAITGEQGPDSVTRSYAFDEDGLTNAGRPNNHLGRLRSQSPLSAFQVDRDISTPYTDELTAGFSRELAPEFALSLTYISRDYRNQLQDIDLNHHTGIDPSTGRFTDYFGSLRFGNQRIADGIPDLYINNPLFNRVLRLGNFNSQLYRGWELELVRRLSRKWQMQASYTYSRTWGDAEDYLSELGNDPSLAEFEPGYLSYDQRHVIKLNAVTYFSRDWQLGWRAQWASGLPYSTVFIADASDDGGYVQSRRLYGHVAPGLGFIRENRNSHRNHAVYDLNARVQKNFVLGRMTAAGFLEVFNLLNTDDLRLRTVEWRGFIPPGCDTCTAQPINTITGERRFGRRYEFGIQFDF
jgi:carboxypeptidase family protein/TonB-dependent receptor-like protein